MEISEKLESLRHSAAHLLAQAVKELYPDVKLGIGPTIENGFYYDFLKNEPFTPDDLKTITKKMRELSKQKLPIEKKELSENEINEFLKEEPLKKELYDELEKGKATFYAQGKFIDLCKGPHLETTREVRNFKLTRVSGAYWRGDSKNVQLQRIYGVAFETKESLDDYKKMLEEAARRDHRKLGKELSLFSIHDAAPGMPFFHDNGTYIYERLKEFMLQEMRKLDYEINLTPIILNKDLWLQSGHWDHYKENMYFTTIDTKDSAVKPMNCPGNLLIFKTKLHSYKELPIKAGEFGLVHRHELSGVLSGLFRVRVFTQDDAHVFCTNDQLKDQIIELIELVDRVYSTFGFKYDIELSTKPEKAMGNSDSWKVAEESLSAALKEKKLDFKVNEGDGAFYGPKIDFHVKDAIGRSWQCGTIQLDFQMPEKFDLTYEGKDGRKHRPVMLHRAIYGSLERFMGVLIEHYAGRFPMWLSPLQVKILTVTDRNVEFAEELAQKMKNANLRVVIDDKNESIAKKVRNAIKEKANYIITIGDKESEKRTLAVRDREANVEHDLDVDKFISKLIHEVNTKKC
ncbi:threonine--tRNA ligase [archaeon]|jgi:threonyl-tRNA synthetase|nr:threonine--tRNA ligase [archaeon]MBT3731284.1 threonine--tRNA ligase [archaeon]MBT4669937.1 threonine--tRNA ligase [archaeon]MBT5029762.1 threonine--tRNA ligase [archaeon]MBT5287489.1 threonine--tRNA ligase [archaeon]